MLYATNILVIHANREKQKLFYSLKENKREAVRAYKNDNFEQFLITASGG